MGHRADTLDPAIPPSKDAPVRSDSMSSAAEGSKDAASVAEVSEPEKVVNEVPVAAATMRTQKSVRWSQDLVSESTYEAPYGPDPVSNPSPSTTFKEKIGGVRDVLGRWGRNVQEAAKKAEDLAGNTWQHLKTSPNLTEAAMGRIAHSAKILAEGGYEKIFHQTFDTVPEEKLKNSYACYLSTSAGPVRGTIYVSTAKLAFCSDDPLPYKNGDRTEWSYYKAIIPLLQLKAVNPSSSRVNPAEKYIQIISVENHEFWYMGFLNYDSAVTCLQESLQSR